jgi:hypothetical protein
MQPRALMQGHPGHHPGELEEHLRWDTMAPHLFGIAGLCTRRSQKWLLHDHSSSVVAQGGSEVHLIIRTKN